METAYYVFLFDFFLLVLAALIPLPYPPIPISLCAPGVLARARIFFPPRFLGSFFWWVKKTHSQFFVFFFCEDGRVLRVRHALECGAYLLTIQAIESQNKTHRVLGKNDSFDRALYIYIQSKSIVN